AMILETLTLMDRRTLASDLVTTLAAELSEDSWYSTQTTAYSLIAIAKFCGKNPSGAKIAATGMGNGKAVNINSASYITLLPLDLKQGSAKLSINNKGTNLIYARIIIEGQPLTAEDLHVNNDPSILVLTVSYLSRDKNPIDINRLTQGTDFVAKVTIKNPGRRGYYERMALTQI